MPRNIKNAKTVNKKSKTHDVVEVSPFTYQVTSGSSGQTYTVKVQDNTQAGAIDFTGAVCDCRWGQYRPNSDPRSGCSHAQAVFAYIEKIETGKTTSAHASFDDAARQHRHMLAIGNGVILTTRAVGT
jgi:hypothetical protein